MQLKSIQALRAIAALAVMMAHLHGIELRQSGEAPLISEAWLSGVSGVDLFFVISGFIMVWVAGDTQPTPAAAGAFLFARFTRIYPLWWLFAGAMMVYFYFTYGVPWDAEMLQRVGSSGPEHLIKSLLLIPHEAFPVLSVGWTLMHEMYFYVVFAGILLLPERWRSPAFILWGLLVLAASSAQLTGFYANTFLSLAFFPMTLEFLMGVAVGLMIKRGARNHAIAALVIGLVWLIVGIQRVDFTSVNILLPAQRTFAYGPAFALILYGSVVLELNHKIDRFIPSSLVKIGDWSYALYLSHLLVLSAIGRLVFAYIGDDGYLDNVVFVILSVSAALFVSGATYYGFERPLNRFFKMQRARFRAGRDERGRPAPEGALPPRINTDAQT